MKLFALAAAIAMTGTAAIAQDTAAPAPAPAETAAAADAAAADPVGGYQPSTPAVQGDTTSGQKPVFQANPQTPSQAFPPPAPMEKYPLCKKGQYDNCRQRGG